MGKVWAVIELIRGLIDLVKYFIARSREGNAKKEDGKQTKLEDAVEDSKTAETDKEVWDAQDRVIDNKS